MSIVVVVLSLIGGFNVARRFVEPACPACSAKRWTDHHPRLECSVCGWSVSATAAHEPLPLALQYEIGLEA